MHELCKRKYIDKMLKKSKFFLENSAFLMAIPDITNTLTENQVFI